MPAGEKGNDSGKGSIVVGTSGWYYDEWVGPVYPRGLPKNKMLDFYTYLFKTCEINTSFYHVPRIETVHHWMRVVPENFDFSVKIYKGITHEALLEPGRSHDLLAAFMKRMTPLDRNVSYYLLQLPPRFSRKKPEHLANLEAFLDHWGARWEGSRLVIEFRNLSWMVDETFKLLSEHSVVYCGVLEPLLPPRLDVTCPGRSYIRFHGYGSRPWFNYYFSREELARWATKIKELAAKGNDIHVFFNNHFSGYAVKNALEFQEILDIPCPRLEDVRRRFSGQTSLDSFL